MSYSLYGGQPDPRESAFAFGPYNASVQAPAQPTIAPAGNNAAYGSFPLGMNNNSQDFSSGSYINKLDVGVHGIPAAMANISNPFSMAPASQQLRPAQTENKQPDERTTSGADPKADQSLNAPTAMPSTEFRKALEMQTNNNVAMQVVNLRLIAAEMNVKLHKEEIDEYKGKDLQLRKACLAALKNMSSGDLLTVLEEKATKKELVEAALQNMAREDILTLLKEKATKEGLTEAVEKTLVRGWECGE